MNAVRLYFDRWNFPDRFRTGIGLLCLGIFIPGLALFFFAVKSGLNITVLGDESEKFVAAQLIENGDHLYRQIFTHHGPVPFMVSHLYAATISRSDFSLIRLSMAVFALLSLGALMFSPVVEKFSMRFVVGGIYLALLSCVWLLQGIHLVLYQQIAGFMFSIMLAQFVLPAFLDKKLSSAGLFFSGASGAVACFCAYSYAPTTLLLLASGGLPLGFGSREKAKILCLLGGGFLSVTIFVAGWLDLFADLPGYFIYHFYFNQTIYAPFVGGFSIFGLLQNLLLNFEPFAVMQSMAVLVFIVWFFALIAKTLLGSEKIPGTDDGFKNRKSLKLHAISLFLLLVGLLFSNPRGEISFQANALIILSLSGFPLVLGFFLEQGLEQKNFGAASLLGLIAFVAVAAAHSQVTRALSNPFGLKLREYLAQTAFLKPVPGSIFDLLGKDDRILALVFCPNVYLTAGHLPASGNLCYFPWQARYNEKPVLNYKIDIYADIKNSNPKIIYFDGWKVWNRYSLDQYGPEVVDLLARNYRKLSEQSGYYVRNDLFKGLTVNGKDDDFRAETTPPLSPEHPLTLSLIHHPGKKVNRIGIKFGTPMLTDAGLVELRLQAENGQEFKKQFQLEYVKNNEYFFFDIAPGTYLSGKIVSVAGGGINTWEVSDNKGSAYTAIIYGFDDGTFEFSPGAGKL